MATFQEPQLPRGYGPSPSGYRFVPYHHVSPPEGARTPLKAYEPTRTTCPFLCGLSPCMCRESRPAPQSYNDPLVPQSSPFSSSPLVKQNRRASAPTSFLQHILCLGSKSQSTHPAQHIQPTRAGPTRTPPSHTDTPAPPVCTPHHTIHASNGRRRNSAVEHARVPPQPVATSSKLPASQTPLVHYQSLPEDTGDHAASWYHPRTSRQPIQHLPYPPTTSAGPAFTPQVASAVLPDIRSTRRQHEPVLSRSKRRKPTNDLDPSGATHYGLPSRHRTQLHAAPIATPYAYGPVPDAPPGAPPSPYVPQISSEYTSPAQPPPLEEPLYFANDAHDPYRWFAPECRLPRPFTLKGRHFQSVTQAVSWWKALAAGDTALARVIKNLDSGLPKKEFERREAHLSNAVCMPAGWLRGLSGVYKTVLLAAFKSDSAGMRTLLLDTRHRELVWDARDWDWGRGGNRYGRILMDVRAQLRQEAHSAAHRKMERRMPPTSTPGASSRHHRTQQIVYPYTGYSDLRQRPSRSGRHHVQFNPTPMVQII